MISLSPVSFTSGNREAMIIFRHQQPGADCMSRKRGALAGWLLLIVLAGCNSSSSPSSTGSADPATERGRASNSPTAASGTPLPTTGATGPGSNVPSGLTRSVKFTEVTDTAGIAWKCRTGEEAGHFVILESLGSGCAVFDYDLDGQLDLAFAGGGEMTPTRQALPLPIALYQQQAPWRYAAVTSSAGLEPIRHYHHGLWIADFDEDGFDDLLLTGWGGLQLFHNAGDGTFQELTDAAGLDDRLWSSAAAWADLNNDQILDLYVGHYVNWSWENDPHCHETRGGGRAVCAPSSFDGLPCTVYLGVGDGTFREASEALGIHEKGKTLGVVVADLNGDLQPEIYVANDTVPNHLYQRKTGEKYRDVAMRTGVALGETGSSDGSMGVDLGDFDGDGRLDIWVANFENESFALYRNLGHDLFSHSSRMFGVTAVGSTAVGFGTVVLDVDGDGRPDIFCSNGHVLSPRSTLERRQLPYLFWNDRGKRMRDIAANSGEYLRTIHHGRGAATGDLDRNGTPDLVITHVNEPVSVLRNETSIPHWCSVRLVGRNSPRSAIGAQVVLTAGGLKQTGLVRGGGSYLSTNDFTLLFGLGDATHVEQLEVRWPSGRVSHHVDIPDHAQLVLIEETE